MYSAFVKLLNMSIAASIVVLAVVLVRLIFRKVPRRMFCLLWALAALRLMLPVGFSSSLSVFNLLPANPSDGEVVCFRYNEKPEKPSLEFSIPATVEVDAISDSTHVSRAYLPPVMELWLVGAAAMMIIGVLSWWELRKKVAASIPLSEKTCAADGIGSPFVLGILRPKIYLPTGMDADTMRFVLIHERAHIRRMDHCWKPLGYVLLSLHWFNPLIWLGYMLFCRDLEMACDEAVVSGMSREDRADYAQALLDCSAPRRVTVCPVAFGESAVGARVRGVLNYQKPGFLRMLMAVLLCLAVALCFLTDPVSRTKAEPEKRMLTMEDVLTLSEKGEALNWQDFEEFTGSDIGFGLYIMRYPIDERYSVRVGGVPGEQPMYVELWIENEAKERIDIRYEPILPFLQAHP